MSSKCIPAASGFRIRFRCLRRLRREIGQNVRGLRLYGHDGQGNVVHEPIYRIAVQDFIRGKLVRDRIPEIITNSGKQCDCSTLSDDEYITMLDAKLNEELAEYQESKSMEELADLLEVIRAVAKARGSSIDEVEAIRRDKAAKRGGFEQKILLVEVRDCEG